MIMFFLSSSIHVALKPDKGMQYFGTHSQRFSGFPKAKFCTSG